MIMVKIIENSNVKLWLYMCRNYNLKPSGRFQENTKLKRFLALSHQYLHEVMLTDINIVGLLKMSCFVYIQTIKRIFESIIRF